MTPVSSPGGTPQSPKFPGTREHSIIGGISRVRLATGWRRTGRLQSALAWKRGASALSPVTPPTKSCLCPELPFPHLKPGCGHAPYGPLKLPWLTGDSVQSQHAVPGEIPRPLAILCLVSSDPHASPLTRKASVRAQGCMWYLL